MATGNHLDDLQLLAVVSGRADNATRRHSLDCATCATRARGWATIAQGASTASAAGAAVPARVLEGALDRIAATPVRRAPLPVRRGMRWGWQLLRAQVPLVRRSMAAATALMLLLGVVVLLSRSAGRSGDVLSLMAPIAAAVGLSLIYGPEIDPPLELAVSTGTSPRLVLMARLVLVFGYDMALGVAATLLTLLCTTSTGFFALLLGWLGPMLLLSSLSFALAVLTRPAIGLSVALGLWALRLLAGAGNTTIVRSGVLSTEQVQAIREAWTTSLPLVLAAAVVLAFTVTVVPHRLQLPS